MIFDWMGDNIVKSEMSLLIFEPDGARITEESTVWFLKTVGLRAHLEEGQPLLGRREGLGDRFQGCSAEVGRMKMVHRTFIQRGEEILVSEGGVVCLENEYAEYFAAREKRIAKRAEERARNEDRAEFAARVNVAIGLMRNGGMKDDDIQRIKDVLLNSNQTGRVAN